jgi:hypothetical protein
MNLNWKMPLLVLLLVAVMGCAARRPVLYPNEHMLQVGEDAAEQDVDECIRLTNEHVSSGEGGEGVARDTAVGAVTGGAAGAVGGAIWGNAGRGAASGAAAGATVGLLHRLFRRPEPSTAHREFVTRCLGDKGYEPIGWQ